jgi:hypothetical protein
MSSPRPKPKLAISFSGGRTSAVMTKLLVERYRDTHDLCITFANTGQEHEATLQFVKDCDDHFGFGTVWLEAVVNHEHRKGVGFKIVDFETASRDGQPFRDVISKYGVPNMGNPYCTGRLKEEVMEKYLRFIGWDSRTYDRAIGIRADEQHRMSMRMFEDRFIYPLVDGGWTKEKVIAEVRTWPFDLQLPGEHYGNCTWCWKKSKRKLLTLAKESPEVFEFPLRMQQEFGTFKVTAATKSPCGRRLFFRGHQTVEDILHEARNTDFQPFVDGFAAREDDPLDYGVGCGESCEIGSDERFGTKLDIEEDWV